MKWKITLCEPDIGQEEIGAVTNVLKSKWLTMGEVTQRFERAFVEKLEVKYAFAVTNGTVALHIANLALNIGSGDEVICPALTFVATANAVRYTRADVIFADSISEKDLTIDPEDVETKITKRTKAIIVVHYGGFSCNMDKIVEIAKKYNLKIIEDCAHSPLAWWRFKNGTRKFVGSIGDIGCFSFFSNKNMITGEGGMITTNSDELAEKIKLLRSHGMTTLTYDRHKGHASGYDVVMLGYNYRIDEMRSALGLVQLKKLERNNQKRREIYRWYADAFKGNDNVIIPFTDRNLEQATPHIMPIIIKNNYQEIKQRLTDADIQTSKHYDLIPTFTLYKGSKFKSKVKYIKNILTLPMYPGMKKEDVEYIRKIINEANK
ncbi:UDP-4-amino-4-deoxy-L-arabinose--oxoglutarate aminotransferase [subsurface metagenome]